MQRVKVVNQNKSWLGTECYIDGNKINNLKSVDFRVAVDEVPHFTFETLGLPDIDMLGTVQFRFKPETVQQAAIILKHEFETNKESRWALYNSIYSLLEERGIEESGRSILATDIAIRIFDLDLQSE